MSRRVEDANNSATTTYRIAGLEGRAEYSHDIATPSLNDGGVGLREAAEGTGWPIGALVQLPATSVSTTGVATTNLPTVREGGDTSPENLAEKAIKEFPELFQRLGER